jgi:hypothetical protein
MTDKTYIRVIPRDLFNEANLLKCMGALWIETERYQRPGRVQIKHDGEPFQIEQTEGGYLTVLNVCVFIRNREYFNRRPLNSRDPWPLYLVNDEDEEFSVFTDDGKLSDEMLALINAA